MILETQGRYKNFWIDINRTAHIGPASQAYRDQYAAVRDIFETISARLRPGVNTAEICKFQDIAAAGYLDPAEKIAGGGSFGGSGPARKPGQISRHRAPWCEGRVRSRGGHGDQHRLLYFGSGLGPSHMENVFIVNETGAEPLYQATFGPCGGQLVPNG